jgi:lysophospholipase L1-like esterase
VRRTRLAFIVVSCTATIAASIVLAGPASAQSSVRYVALGDSYSSGLGADSYTAESGSCKRSTNAYPALWAANNAPASYVSVACSGAVTADVINAQTAALSAATTLVSITIGGNDVGFSDIMTTCVLDGTSDCVNAVQAAENKVQSTLPGLLDNVYNSIRAKAPAARVVVLSYPVFYQLNTFCIGLSTTSRTKIDEGINLLDATTGQAAARHGFVFADVRSTFVGHQLCSYGSKWLHALNITDIGESYHPTAAGQSGGYYPVFRANA